MVNTGEKHDVRLTNPPTLSAYERGVLEFTCLFVPLYDLFILLLIPFSFGSTPVLVRFSVGF